jgi:hypothetical protein
VEEGSITNGNRDVPEAAYGLPRPLPLDRSTPGVTTLGVPLPPAKHAYSGRRFRFPPLITLHYSP